MSPLGYLRRHGKSMTADQRARFLEACAAINAGIRSARLAPTQLAATERLEIEEVER